MDKGKSSADELINLRNDRSETFARIGEFDWYESEKDFDSEVVSGLRKAQNVRVWKFEPGQPYGVPDLHFAACGFNWWCETKFREFKVRPAQRRFILDLYSVGVEADILTCTVNQVLWHKSKALQDGVSYENEEPYRVYNSWSWSWYQYVKDRIVDEL